MTIARVSMVEYKEEGAMETLEKVYGEHRDEWFPNLEQVINIKTSPTTAISIALYPSFDEAEKNLDGRAEMVKVLEPHIREQFYYEGEVVRNDIIKH